MAKQRSWLLRLLFLVVLLIVAAVVLSPFLPLTPLKPVVEARLSNMLGRRVTVGSLRLNLIGGPYIDIDDMTAQEDPAFGEGNFLVADHVRADVGLRDLLLRREVVIQGLNVKAPDLTFVKDGSGAWSWSTLGKNNVPAQTAGALLNDWRAALLVLLQAATGAAVDRVNIEDASIKLIDRQAGSAESIYKNVDLNASMTRPDASTSKALGELNIDSQESAGAEQFQTRMPFDLTLGRGATTGISVQGVVGPGPIQSKNFSADGFKIEGTLPDFQQTFASLNGNGRMTSGPLLIATANVGEQVARTLQIDQIGDMSAGTRIGSLESDFRLDQGVVRTENLRLQDLDGLGDATSNQGWFEIASTPTLNFPVTLQLTPEATQKVKSSSPLYSTIISILQTSDRFAASVNVTGEVRNPQVQVDLNRTLFQ